MPTSSASGVEVETVGPVLKNEVAAVSPDDPGLVHWVESSLRELADPERKAVTSNYFPSAMEILGVSAPRIRASCGWNMKKSVKCQSPCCCL